MGYKLLLAVPLALSLFTPYRDELAFAPEKGLVLIKTFELSSESEGETTHDNGSASSSNSMEARVVVRDEVLERDDERVTKLARTFEEVSGEQSGTFDPVPRRRILEPPLSRCVITVGAGQLRVARQHGDFSAEP